MRKWLPLLTAVVLALQLAGCGADGTDSNSASTDVPTASAEASKSASPSTDPASSGTAGASPSASAPAGDQPTEAAASGPVEQLKRAAIEAAEALRDRDLKRLSSRIDPELGLRFSPYAHMDDKQDQVFAASELPSFKSTDKLAWGTLDGSGEAIKLTFRDYFERFVYDQDFAGAPTVSVNKLVGKGNTAYNGQSVYKNASFVEFHYPGFDSKLEGMDWESLILTFVPDGTEWRLVAITHAQWTI
ncbi:hypothetical protein [Cohnella nanjingensis]|uniref:Uncharacterized protein n=1 Tax=Cohnella nanjingensis TaxID=1387779 RepID=A0A7X0RMA4_9BACL|nr:hypothetical protein [Cohnella nanjingensis]MBB6669913.1 hypothetical protein [Cohnella nanjingensis]